MTITLKHHWWRTHRESRWVCTLHTAHDTSLSGLQTWAPCWVLPNSLHFWVLGLATPCSSFMSQMQGTYQKQPTSSPITHKWDRIFHPEEATHKDSFRLWRGQWQGRAFVVSATSKFKKTPLLLEKGPPMKDESNSTSFNRAILYSDNNPEIHTDAEEVASSKL